MNLPEPNESNFTPLPAGTYTATCYRFIDKGTQQSDYMGEKKTRREVMLSWEIANETMDDGRPFTISKTYTWSMHEKSTLRKHLEAWRGRPFVQDDFHGPNRFNTKKLIGVPCTLTITADEGQNGNTYTKVASVGQVMKGMQVPPLQNERIYLALEPDGWNQSVFDALHEKVQEKIAASPEYQSIKQNGSGSQNQPSSRDMDDDVPF